MTDLLPCPFCGGTNLFVFPPSCTEASEYSLGDNAQPVVRCHTCFAAILGKTWDHGMKSAITAWNTRTPPQITDAMVDAALLATLGRNWPTKETMRAALAAGLGVR